MKMELQHLTDLANAAARKAKRTVRIAFPWLKTLQIKNDVWQFGKLTSLSLDELDALEKEEGHVPKKPMFY